MVFLRENENSLLRLPEPWQKLGFAQGVLA